MRVDPGAGGERAALRGQCHVRAADQPGPAQRQVAIGGNAHSARSGIGFLAAVETAAGVAHHERTRLHGERIARAPAAAVDGSLAGYPCLHRPVGAATGIAGGVISQALRLQRQIGAGPEHAFLQAHAALRGQVEIASGRQRGTRAGDFQRGCAGVAGLRNAQVARRRGLALQLHTAGRVEPEVVDAGCRVAQHAHAYAGFGCDDANAAGIHAAQRGRVDCMNGRGAIRCRAASDFAAGIAPGVIAGNDADAAAGCGVDLAVDNQRAGDDVEDLLRAGVQATAIDQHVAARHIEAVDAAVGSEVRHAGGQRCAVGIDKAAAAAGDAIRVGDDHVGLAAQHFGEAGQGAAVARHHFVEDDARFPGEVRVAIDCARKL